MKSENRIELSESEIISRAMGILGSRKSPHKAAQARANGQRGGRPAGSVKPLIEIPCECHGGAVLDVDAHKASCPRGRAIRRRIAAGQPIE